MAVPITAGIILLLIFAAAVSIMLYGIGRKWMPIVVVLVASYLGIKMVKGK